MEKIDIFSKYTDKVKELSVFDKNIKKNTTLEPELVELINVYVSTINGCAYCLTAHTTAYLKIVEKPTKLNMVTVWRESSLFDSREKSALFLAEKITKIHDTSISNGLLLKILGDFSEEEYIDLLFVIITINSFNRLLIGSRNSFV